MKISAEDARKALDVIAHELETGAGWQDAKEFLSRPENLGRVKKLDVYDHLGDDAKVLLIENRSYPHIRHFYEKLEAALIYAEVLVRTSMHKYNGGIAYPSGTGGIIVNAEGRETLAAAIESQQAISVAAR
jgi:hypothetical protein